MYCIIYGQRNYQKAFFNWFCQYLPFLNIFFNSFCQYLYFLSIFFKRICPVEKCGVNPHSLCRDSLTLKQKTSTRVIQKKIKSSSKDYVIATSFNFWPMRNISESYKPIKAFYFQNYRELLSYDTLPSLFKLKRGHTTLQARSL